MRSIILIIPYFGKWPIWFDAYLCSITTNPTINWLCPTDCQIPKEHPKNITFLPTTLQEMNKHINLIVDANVPLNVRKFCDLKPAYGDIFYEQVKDYDFWGFCDMDIIWGNIRKFITDDLLDKYDIISALENMVCGHFTIFKNNERNLNIYKNDLDYKKIFKTKKHLRYDEVGLTTIVEKLYKDGLVNVLWDEKLLQDGIKSEVHQEYFLDRWLYENGAVYDLFDPDRKEYMYLHFINWKRTMRFCEIKYQDNPNQFFISFNRIHYKPHSVFTKMLNGIKNIFDGYYAILFKKSILKKIKKRLK